MGRGQDLEAEVFVSQASLWELEAEGDHRDPFDRLLVCQSRTVTVVG